MKLKFTKMHGLGNDFVVIDATSAPVELTRDQLRLIADRHFGVGCDQILQVEPAREPGTDFHYRIFNADGGEVEQCGNGARCFVKFVRAKGLTRKREIRVETRGGIIGPRLEADVRRMNAFIEDRVREMPEQYFWAHKRFKTRPPGEPNPYKRR